MSNFSPKLQDSTDDQLWHLINESNPNYAMLASDELNRRSLNKLQKTIEEENKETGRFSLAFILLALTQIALAFWQFMFNTNGIVPLWQRIIQIVFLAVLLGWCFKLVVVENKQRK